MNIIPLPQSVEYTCGCAEIPEIVTLSITCATEQAIISFTQRLEAVDIKTVFSPSPFITLLMRDDYKPNKPGAYKIEIFKDGIEVTYGGAQGAHNACATLYFLLRQAAQCGGKIKCSRIEDFPQYAYRGMHLDTARSFFPVEEIIKIIEQLSLIKLNYFHWHFADDQAWSIQSEKYNNLTSNRGNKFYTREQVKQIVSFAQSRGIEIIPEFEIPGHSSAAIEAYPQLSCKGKAITAPAKGGIYKTILCAGKAEALTFIKDIIDELCALFPGKYIHLGGDEAPKTEWKACPHCRAAMKKNGLKAFEQLQGNILTYAAEIARQNGKAAICWNDCLKADNLSKSIIIQYWTQASVRNYAAEAAGRKFIFSNLLPLYFDYPHFINSLKRVYNFKPNIRFNKRLSAFDIMGAEAAVWCERIKTCERLEYMMFPRCAALAEAIWGTAESYNGFLQRLKAYCAFLDTCNIFYAPIKNIKTII